MGLSAMNRMAARNYLTLLFFAPLKGNPNAPTRKVFAELFAEADAKVGLLLGWKRPPVLFP